MIVALLAVMTALADPATDGPAIPTLRVETRVVQIEIVATDSKGKPVTGLKKEDFTILDGGKARQIDLFSVSSDQPSAIAKPTGAVESLPPNVFSNRNPPPPVAPPHATVIVIDAAPSDVIHELGSFRTVQSMAAARVRVMKPDERIAVYVTSKHEGLKLLQDYTNDKVLLLKKIMDFSQPGLQAGLSPWMVYEPLSQDYRSDKELMAPLPRVAAPSPEGTNPRRDPNFVPRRETEGRIDDSVRENRLSLQEIAERLALLPGRKNIFWATLGMPPGLMRGIAWEKTFTALNEANVSVNVPGCSMSSRAIAEATGGATTCVDSPDAAAVIDAARVTYTLGFYLADDERDDTYRSIKVKVNRPHTELFYRQGYYAGKSPEALMEKKPELESALLSPVEATGVGLTARITRTPGTPQGTLMIQLNLDPATVSLQEKNGGWVGNVDELFVELNDVGNTLGRVSDKKEFDVATGSRESYERNGVSWPMQIPLAAGATKISIVVRDDKSGRLGSVTVPLADLK